MIGWVVAAALAVLFYRLGVWKKALPPADETEATNRLLKKRLKTR
ncbi:MAG: hypothetical protein ACLUFV_13435 [Acutalibacteraceae bacterium]